MLTWSTALLDWEERIVAGRSLLPCPPLFQEEADAALDIFRDLKIVDAAGSPTIGESCRPWVMDFASSIFGSYDKETGRRLIRYFFLLVSKKNSKSTLAAGIMLTALMRNWRNSAEFIILAPTIEVAQNSFKPALDMVKADPELRDLLKPNANLRTITHRTTGAVLKVIAADNDTVSGKKAVGVLIDELWLFGKRPNAENLFREATGGLASRPEGFVIYLTTQSEDPPAGVFLEKLNEFRAIRDGKLKDPKSLGMLYEFPERMLADEDHYKPENFYVTNPNLGVSVDEEFLLDQLEKARRAGTASLCSFAAKHLNVQIGIRLRSNAWQGAKFWERQTDESLTLKSLLNRSEVVVVGVDGGGLDDLFGFCVLGREKVTKKWLVWSHAWVHDGVLEERKSIAALLRDFEDRGELTIVDDQLQDISMIIRIIKVIEDRQLLHSVAVDPAGLGELVEELDKIGLRPEDKRVVGAPQGIHMMNSIKTAERKLASGTIEHCPSTLMTWCVSNLKIEPTATAIRATKQNAGDAKIDPAIAFFNAVFEMSTNPDARLSSYSDRGLLVI